MSNNINSKARRHQCCCLHGDMSSWVKFYIISAHCGHICLVQTLPTSCNSTHQGCDVSSKQSRNGQIGGARSLTYWQPPSSCPSTSRLCSYSDDPSSAAQRLCSPVRRGLRVTAVSGRLPQLNRAWHFRSFQQLPALI